MSKIFKHILLAITVVLVCVTVTSPTVKEKKESPGYEIAQVSTVDVNNAVSDFQYAVTKEAGVSFPVEKMVIKKSFISTPRNREAKADPPLSERTEFPYIFCISDGENYSRQATPAEQSRLAAYLRNEYQRENIKTNQSQWKDFHRRCL